jgi:hypothetical protein
MSKREKRMLLIVALVCVRGAAHIVVEQFPVSRAPIKATCSDEKPPSHRRLDSDRDHALSPSRSRNLRENPERSRPPLQTHL